MYVYLPHCTYTNEICGTYDKACLAYDASCDTQMSHVYGISHIYVSWSQYGIHDKPP